MKIDKRVEERKRYSYMCIREAYSQFFNCNISFTHTSTLLVPVF